MPTPESEPVQVLEENEKVPEVNTQAPVDQIAAQRKPKSHLLIDTVAAGSMFLAALHFGAGVTLNISQNSDNETRPRIAQLIRGLNTYAPDQNKDKIASDLRYNYVRERNDFMDLYGPLLDGGTDSETKKTIVSDRKKIVLDGAIILGMNQQEIPVTVSSDNKTVNLGIQKFDISDTTELFFADAIISKATTHYDKAQTEMTRFLTGKDLEALRWLYEQKPAISFDDFSLPLSYPDQLVNIALFYETLYELGYPTPAPIKFTRYTKEKLGSGGGFYQSDIKKITISNATDTEAGPHEESHHQADTNKNFSQAKFNEMVENIMQKDDLSPLAQEAYIDPKVRSWPWFEGSPHTVNAVLVEDYAQTLTYYLLRGNDFRRAVEKLKLQNSPYYELLKAKYDFAKGFNQGKEFVANGYYYDSKFYEVSPEEFSPKEGDVFEISDPERDYNPAAAIALRRNPDAIIEATNNFVTDSRDILLLENPVDGKDKFGNDVKYVHVLAGDLLSRQGKSVFEPTLNFDEGWIEMRWLGAKRWDSSISLPEEAVRVPDLTAPNLPPPELPDENNQTP